MGASPSFVVQAGKERRKCRGWVSQPHTNSKINFHMNSDYWYRVIDSDVIDEDSISEELLLDALEQELQKRKEKKRNHPDIFF